MLQMPRGDRVAPSSRVCRDFLKNARKAALAAPPTVDLITTATAKPAEASPLYWGPACVYQEETETTD